MKRIDHGRPPLPEGVHESPPMLINEISRLFAAKMRENENEMQQESVRLIIICLSRQDGITQLELSRYTHLKPPTVSITLKQLEAKGLITRKTDDNDMRAVRVFLTEKGHRLNENSLAALRQLDNILMEGINDDESAILLSLLRRIRDNVIKNMGSDGGKTD